MLTLQKSFRYAADPTKLPFSKVPINVSYPVFTFNVSDTGGQVTREKSATNTITFSQQVAGTEYFTALPEGSMFSNAFDLLNRFFQFNFNSPAPTNVTLSDLTVTMQAMYGSSAVTPDTTILEGIYFLKDLEPVQRLTRRLDTRAADGNAELYINKNLYLVNKTVFKKFLEKFGNISAEPEGFYLLYTINQLIDLNGKAPALRTDIDEPLKSKMIAILISLGVQESAVKNVIDYTITNFAQLFDFPLLMPEQKTVDISGTFEVVSGDNTEVGFTDLLLFDLSVEFSTYIADNTSLMQIQHFDWMAHKTDFHSGKIKFSFTQENPILLSSVDGNVSVKVKNFDKTIIWSKDYKADDLALGKLAITVPLQRPNVITTGDKSGSKDENKRLRGQLVELSKKCNLKGVTVLVQAKKGADQPWQIVGAAEADSAGNFSMAYPFGVYIAAQALVSLTPESPVDIATDSATKNNQSISSDFLYLLVKGADCDSTGDSHGDDDCECHSVKKSGRLPAQEDLINSDQYSQDIGGSCVNLSTPNRTLREYTHHAIVRTSDPDVANYTLRKLENGSFELVGDNKKIKRAGVDLDNPVRWQDAPDAGDNLSFYQSVTVATGHILHYKSEFKADGYSMGDLLYSLALAPGQKKQMVVIDANHSIVGAENQSVAQGETLAANLLNERSITDQLGGNISEAMRGSSTASTSGVSAGLGVGVSYGGIGAALGVAGGYSNANSSASQNSSRNVSQFFGERLRQSIMQNAESYRQLNASVVTSVQEGQTYGATADVVANHNHCHALTMMYFEVLRHFAIYQELVNVEECVFVPLLMTNFTTENIYKWSDVLAKNLLPMSSNTYLKPFSYIAGRPQHPLLKAFDANERIKTNYVHVDYPTGSYDQEQISFLKGYINLRTNLQRPKTKYDRIKSLPIITKTVTKEVTDARSIAKSAMLGIMTGGLSFLFGSDGSHTETEEILAKEKIFDSFMQLDANYEYVPPAKCIRVVNFEAFSIKFSGISINISPIDFFQNGIIDKKLWDAYASILGYKSTLEMLDYYFKGRLISEWDDIYYNDIAPVVFDKIVDSIRMEYIATDMTSTSRYKGGERVMSINFEGTTNKRRIDFPLTMKLFCNSPVVKTLKDLVTLTVENVRIAYSTPHFNGLLYGGSVGDDLLDDTMLYIPENAEEKKDPRKEDRYLVQKLIEHLNSNLEHYNKALWYNLDADRRYMLLDGFNIQIFNDFGIPVGFRSLASVVKNQLMSIVGNSLVLPVAPGYKVSQSFITEKTGDGVEQEVTLLDHYQPLTPVPPYRISVPTRGVFMEAVQGACDACEKVKENSSQDWTKFPTDEPSQINAITPPVPTVTDWKAAFKDFATPIVNIQNAPATPEPGSGLAGITELLGKAGIFKDITGLDANQQNAIKTYLSNQENAKAFAEMAKSMAMQGHNTDNSSKIMDTLKTAKDSGAISNEDYGKLVKEHLQQQIDGGASKKAELEKDKAAQKPTLTDAAVKAADQGKDVKAQKTDAEGNVESVEISSSGKNGNVLASVDGVPKMLQDNRLACWATAATMMINWKLKKTMSVPTVLALAGDEYLDKFNNKQGLKSSEKEAFIGRLGMVGESPADYPLQQYIDWMKTYGPLWITMDASIAEGLFSPHARILTRIEGTGNPTGTGTFFVFNDPATGTEKSMAFLEFIAQFEQMATDNKSDNLFVQVVHFKDKIDEDAEGYQVQGPWNVHNAVHENITLAALIKSAVGTPASTKVGSDSATNEFFRGVMWNDDPAVLLFDENKYDNWDFSSGIIWKNKFDAGGKASANDLKNLTGRSHYWDLQFLHAMSAAVGEDPKDTQAKILLWVETMYKLSIGEGIMDTDTLKSIPVTAKFGSTTYTMNTFFTAASDPTDTDTINTLLNRNTKCVFLNNSRRAIGSVMHLIQDSFAKGHVKRVLKNPGDLKTGSTDQFQPGKYGDYGDIQNFHCYKGQNHTEHDKYDDYDASLFDTSKLETFNGLIGARNSIDFCVRLLNFWKAKTPYSSGPKVMFENEIFKLAPGATPSDTSL
ncbi:papain-like cysteine protease family protein [Chitinophaga sp. Hz27]|uniref:papain-like cysteine protease family protein n=1 Tax=Chitinophaga sp. Hz27 TaxID=3347169 RepID=UPI0035DFA4E5